VRQLESLIRLSEAIAKANCVEDVTDAMVIEAFNLLRMSIISVEKDDVEVDDEEAEAQPPADGDGDSPMAEGETNEELAEDGTPAPRPQRTKITWEKYNKMMNLLARRINDDELSTGEGVEQEELTIWYLEQIEEELESPEHGEAETELVRKVLKRMVKVFHSCLARWSFAYLNPGQYHHANSR
jgi:DNA replication licensing factor MCM6